LISEKEEKENMLLRWGFERGISGENWQCNISVTAWIINEEMKHLSLEQLHALIKERLETAKEMMIRKFEV